MYKIQNSLKFLGSNKVVPVVVIDDAADAVPLAAALKKGGCNIMEITMRTAAAIPALKAIRAVEPEMIIGMGTVTNVEMFKQAVFWGAEFIVSPGSSEELFKHAADYGVTYVPGVMTSSEIMVAREYGFLLQKFFPAALAGGISALKTYASVYADVLFFPTGGITGDNYQDYLSLNNVSALGGTWIAKREDIAGKQWDKITARLEMLTTR